jgi:hypothetical protein
MSMVETRDLVVGQVFASPLPLTTPHAPSGRRGSLPEGEGATRSYATMASE